MRFLFSIIWRRWLTDTFYGDYKKVVRIKGWRTALVESRKGGNRQTISPCFTIFGVKFDLSGNTLLIVTTS